MIEVLPSEDIFVLTGETLAGAFAESPYAHEQASEAPPTIYLRNLLADHIGKQQTADIERQSDAEAILAVTVGKYIDEGLQIAPDDVRLLVLKGRGLKATAIKKLIRVQSGINLSTRIGEVRKLLADVGTEVKDRLEDDGDKRPVASAERLRLIAKKTGVLFANNGDGGEMFARSIIDPPHDWGAEGKCREDDPDALFVQGAAQNRAKLVCFGCPVITHCIAAALRDRIEFGVWGGMTERQRRAILKKTGQQIGSVAYAQALLDIIHPPAKQEANQEADTEKPAEAQPAIQIAEAISA